MTMPLTGSTFDTGNIESDETQTCVNDDNVGCGPWDTGDTATAGDPIEPVADLVAGGSVARAELSGGGPEDIQTCTLTIDGETINVSMLETFDERTCAGRAAFYNRTGQPVRVVGVEMVGDPPVTLRLPTYPHTGSCAVDDAIVFVYFELASTGAGIPGAWDAAELNVNFETTASCP
jgi:hypothetical protein